MVLPAGITFSMRRSWLSNSSGPLSLLVMTSTNGAPALTLISSGWKRLFSMVSAISPGASAVLTALGVRARPAVSAAASRAAEGLTRLSSPFVRALGVPNFRKLVNSDIALVLPRRGEQVRVTARAVGQRSGGPALLAARLLDLLLELLAHLLLRSEELLELLRRQDLPEFRLLLLLDLLRLADLRER